MKPEERDEHEKKLLWLWIALLAMLLIFAKEDACEVRKDNPEMEENAYFLTCDSE